MSEELDHVDQKVIDDVERYGWSSMSVAPALDSDDPMEWWTYTIGLSRSYGWPEMVIFGLDNKTCHALISDAIAECKARELKPKPGIKLLDVIKGFPARLIDGSSIPDHYLGQAVWYYRHIGSDEELKKVQLLWPDKAGIFPDDSACDPEFRNLQTPLEMP